jgi:hypothetical protein
MRAPDVLWVSKHGAPDPKKLKPVKNSEAVYLNKPHRETGLWTSPVDSEDSWKHWSHGNEPEWVYDESRRWFVLYPDVDMDELVIIDSFEQMCDVLRRYPYTTERTRQLAERMGDLSSALRNQSFDFERMASDGYAGMWLTAQGNAECHLPMGYEGGLPPDMNAWDCETILWFRWCFKGWHEVEKQRLKEDA